MISSVVSYTVYILNANDRSSILIARRGKRMRVVGVSNVTCVCEEDQN